jgi:hypothetical protein
MFRQSYFKDRRFSKRLPGNRSTKYGNVSKNYNGSMYHSLKEMRFAMDLDLQLKGKAIAGWERQVKMDLRVHGQHVTNYYVDFRVTHLDGLVEYVEVKGYETPEWKLKWRLFEILMNAEHPLAKLTVVR